IGRYVEHLGNAEIQQLGLAFTRDENVRRLQVPMHDEVPVQVADGGTNFEEQFDLASYAESGSVSVNSLPLDVFHDKIRLPIFAMTCVQEACNVGMRQTREDLSFDQEALPEHGIIASGPQELHGDVLRNLA